MGVVASVTSTFSFPLFAGNCIRMLLALMIKFVFFTRWPCRNDLGLVHPLPVCSVHRSIPCRDDICHAVRKPSVILMTEPKPVKDKRWALLFLGQVGSATVCALGKLDHWVGECDWSSRLGLLYRLHLVRQILYLHDLIFKFIMYGLSAQMITTAITIGSDGNVVLSSGATYGILLAILVFHGVVCSAATRILARLNLAYVVMNGKSLFPSHNLFSSRHSHTQFHPVGTTISAIIILFVCSKHRGERVSANTAFTLLENNTGWANGELFVFVYLLHLTTIRWLGIPPIIYICDVDANRM
jgi:hypothetical protein